MNRKKLVKTLSEVLGSAAKYLGTPSFAYEIKTEEETYTIDRQGGIITSQGRVCTLNEILKGEQFEEKIEDTAIDKFDLEIPLGEHTGRTLMNILNMLYSKQQLIVKAFELKEPFIQEAFIKNLDLKKTETLEEFKEAVTEVGVEGCKGITFNFEKETFVFKVLGENLSHEKISAFMELASLINTNAQKLKHTSFKQAQEDNPKYAFRTWLTRLGMNGSRYKDIRKTLLSNLEGSCAFRKLPQEGSAEING
ncbi:virulence-related protein [Clostridium botulinum]|nr:virulence-related protein [Clostridium botulinum]NFL64522.1 virulence-related protein [Clostridium botulinum]NFN30202.1 virulence-related protein [Clostridium botulinum]